MKKGAEAPRLAQSAATSVGAAVLLNLTTLFAVVVLIRQQLTHKAQSKPWRPREWKRGELNPSPRQKRW
jgi:hypothetical protein